MASQVFVNGVTLTDSGWFNDTNTITYTGTTAQILVGGGTGSVGVWTTATGTGSPVRATSPTLTTPVLGVATGTSFQGIIGNVTPAAGSFTTLAASGIITGSGTYIISKDTSAYSAGVTGSGILLQGLDSASGNANLGVIQTLARAGQAATLKLSALGSSNGLTIDGGDTGKATFGGALTVTGNALMSGTLGVTGQTSLTLASGNAVIIQPSTATNAAYVQMTNTGGNLFIGLNNSTGSTLGTGAGNYGTAIVRPAATGFSINRAGTDDLTISSAGAVTIPGTLGVTGSIIGESYMYGKTGGYFGASAADAARINQASIGAATTTYYIGNSSINVTSDERIKTNVRLWDGDASAVLRSLPVKAWDKYLSDDPQAGYEGGYVGFTAQDMHKVAPWSVNTQGDTELPWQARYEFLNGIIVKGWQEHEARIVALEAKLLK